MYEEFLCELRALCVQARVASAFRRTIGSG